MEDFNRILFHKYGPAYKQNNCQSINESVVIIIVMKDFNSILFHKLHNYQSIIKHSINQ
jgi:hypothetical protein